MDRNTLLIILGVAVVAAIIYLYSSKDHYDGNIEIEQISTPLEVEYINGEPDVHAVDIASGAEMIPTGDISLGEGYGVSAGTFGFGRTGSTFMA